MEIRNNSYTKIYNKIFDDTELTSTDIFIYQILCIFADEENGKCSPSHQEIADKARVSKSTIMKSLKKLVERGYITKTSRKDFDGGTLSNEYCIVDYKNNGIGNRLKKLRISKQLTMQELADKFLLAGSGTINNWEKGKSKPKDTYIKKYADFFDVAFDWIKTGETDFDMYMKKANELMELDIPENISEDKKEHILAVFGHIRNKFEYFYWLYSNKWDL